MLWLCERLAGVMRRLLMCAVFNHANQLLDIQGLLENLDAADPGCLGDQRMVLRMAGQKDRSAGKRVLLEPSIDVDAVRLPRAEVDIEDGHVRVAPPAAGLGFRGKLPKPR